MESPLKHELYGVTQQSCLGSKPFLFAVFSSVFDRDDFLELLGNNAIYSPVSVHSDDDLMDRDFSQ